jgi:DNA-binding transcriptional LysR family regulator
VADEIPADFDLNLLRALDRLLVTRSVSVAARALGVGQPAMSKSLQRLREHLGDPLLCRVGHSLVLTPRGSALIDPVRAALQATGRALARPEAFDPATARSQLAVAMPEHVHTTLGLPLLVRLRSAAPGLDLRLRPLHPGSRAELVRGELQLAVLPDFRDIPGLPRVDVSQFVLRPLYRDRYSVASRPVNARGGRKRRRWTLDSYAAAQHVLCTSVGESDTGFVDTVLARHGRTRRVAVTVPGFLQAVRIAATTDLIATLPERFLRAAGFPLDVEPPPCALPELPLQLVWHPRDSGEERLRWLREQITACVASGGGHSPAAAPTGPSRSG